MDNIIIKNVFSQEQIDKIYKIVDSTPEEHTELLGIFGQKAYQVSLGDDIRQHLESTIQDIYGENWILKNYQFARYSKKFGYETKLFPHSDEIFTTHRITLDIQLRSTTDWPIVVEGKEFLLADNEGLIFSGTDQIHWRSPKNLSPDDVVDMVFCHCETKDGSLAITQEERIQLKLKEHQWLEEVNISRESILIEGETSGD